MSEEEVTFHVMQMVFIDPVVDTVVTCPSTRVPAGQAPRGDYDHASKDHSVIVWIEKNSDEDITRVVVAFKPEAKTVTFDA